MTPGERKTEIKKVMLEHLKERGYPNMTNEEIMGELKPLWVKLEESGFLAEGMTFSAFQQYANAAHLFSQLRQQF